MKTVNARYFKPSGKYYTDETFEISEELNSYEALFKEIPKHHRLKDMIMVVSDSDDGKEPYIVPHMFKNLE